MRQTVIGDPLSQGFRQTIADFFCDVLVGQRIECTDEMIQRHPRFGFAERVLIQIFAGEFFVEILR